MRVASCSPDKLSQYGILPVAVKQVAFAGMTFFFVIPRDNGTNCRNSESALISRSEIPLIKFNKNAHDYRGPATLDYSIIIILFFYFASEIFKAIVVVDYVYWK